MNATEPHIDLTRLEKIRRTGNKLTARCPACSVAGGDKQGVHLFVNTTTGQWGCGCFPGDKPHRQQISALVGIKGERPSNPERDREWRLCQAKQRLKGQQREALANKARECRDSLAMRHAWALVDVWEDSPQRIDCELVESDSRNFLASLFSQDVVLWKGQVTHSGISHASHWRTCRKWVESPDREADGPMVTPATWNDGTVSRTAANVATAPFTVLDFDGQDGNSPITTDETEKHLAASLGIIRWLREAMQWKLAAILHTGNKSLHAWFHTPPPSVLASLKPLATSLGIDSGLIGRAEHPCRLPGHLHAKTDKLSHVLWLQTPKF